MRIFIVVSYDQLVDRHIDDVIIGNFCLFIIKQIDSMLPYCICSVIDHRRRQNVLKTQVTNAHTLQINISQECLP